MTLVYWTRSLSSLDDPQRAGFRLSCALAHSACRNAYSASYRRLPRLLTELAIARADGRYAKLLASLLFFTAGASLDAIKLSPAHDRQGTGRRRGSDGCAILGFFGCRVPVGNDRSHLRLPSAMMPMRFLP